VVRGSPRQGRKFISDYAPVWDYAKKVGLPEEFVMLAFQVFKDRYLNSEKGKRKTYRDWRLPSSTPSRPTGSDCGASMRMAATASPAPACRLISSIGRLRDPRPLLAHHEATRRLPLGSA
jgi:hypothetical protein